MPLHEKDLVRLKHMLEASEQALQFCQGRVRTDLASDPMLDMGAGLPFPPRLFSFTIRSSGSTRPLSREGCA